METYDNNELILEEQKVVDELVVSLESDIKNADNRLRNILKNHRKAKEQGPEAYGVIVDGLNTKKQILSGIQRARSSIDELYVCRIRVLFKDEDGRKEEEEIKIGLSTYISKSGKILVCDWRRDVCRNFLLDNFAEETDGIVEGKYGEKYKTHYTLKFKRNIDARFGLVRNVTHLFPLSKEKAEKIIFDAFLSELAQRRQNSEFQNIIFSIQRRQGEIIKIPYEQDIIVQGCAGSGKSMIMLHRLPIMLYDNPQILNSTNVYIISPSETYIQMVENMREELDIIDLKMGTINQYYDYVLSKYNVDLDIYGKISYATSVSKDQEEFIYSKALLSVVQNYANKFINEKNHDFIEGLVILGLAKKRPASDFIDAQIASYVLTGNMVIDANNKVLKGYFNVCKAGINVLKDIADKLKNRQNIIIDDIDKKIASLKKLIVDKNKSLEKEHLSEVQVANRKSSIEVLIRKIYRYEELKQEVKDDESYFLELKNCCDTIDLLVEMFGGLKMAYEDYEKEDVYKILNMRKNIYRGYRSTLMKIEELPIKYSELGYDILEYVKKYENQMTGMLKKSDEYLELEYYQEVIEATEYYTRLHADIVYRIYLAIMESCGQVPNEKGELKALTFSPYLYLKIMYIIKGAPNAVKEKLICIDEAQGLSPEELKLIRDINGKELIFNLYGDVKQHMEGTKGIDSWHDFYESLEVQEQLLLENYRNASQITQECNKRFGMSMKAINTPGSGVTVLENEFEFDDKLRKLFVSVPKPGLRAIIVDDTHEAKHILTQYVMFQNKIHDMTGNNYDVHRSRWNLITIEQAKGLEFATVMAISGRMTPNRKYIAYTRALDELIIYDELLHIEQNIFLEKTIRKTRKLEKEMVEKGKNKKQVSQVIDYSKSEVRRYFEEKGIEVNDMRSKGGALWIIGEQAKIKQFVDEACEKFGISGSYSAGKATGFKPGCYFKTKK